MNNNKKWLYSGVFAVLAFIVIYPLYSGMLAYIMAGLAALFASIASISYLRSGNEKEERNAMLLEEERIDRQESERIRQEEQEQRELKFYEQVNEQKNYVQQMVNEQVQSVVKALQAGQKAHEESSTRLEKQMKESDQRQVTTLEQLNHKFHLILQTIQEQYRTFKEDEKKERSLMAQSIGETVEDLVENQNDFGLQFSKQLERLQEEHETFLKSYSHEQGEENKLFYQTFKHHFEEYERLQSERDQSLDERMAQISNTYKTAVEENGAQAVQISTSLEKSIHQFVIEQKELIDQLYQFQKEHASTTNKQMKHTSQSVIDQLHAEMKKLDAERFEMLTKLNNFIEKQQELSIQTQEKNADWLINIEKYVNSFMHQVEDYQKVAKLSEENRQKTMRKTMQLLKEDRTNRLSSEQILREQLKQTVKELIEVQQSVAMGQREEWKEAQAELIQQSKNFINNVEKTHENMLEKNDSHFVNWLEKVDHMKVFFEQQYNQLTQLQQEAFLKFTDSLGQVGVQNITEFEIFRKKVENSLNESIGTMIGKFSQQFEEQKVFLEEGQRSYHSNKAIMKEHLVNMERLTERIVKEHEIGSEASVELKGALTDVLERYDRSAKSLERQLEEALEHSEEIYDDNFKKLDVSIQKIVQLSEERNKEQKKLIDEQVRTAQNIEEELEMASAATERTEKSFNRRLENLIEIQEELPVAFNELNRTLEGQIDQAWKYSEMLKDIMEMQQLLNEEDLKMMDQLLKGK